MLTDEHISVLNVVPEIIPDLLLGRALDVDKVTSDLDVRAIDDRELRPNFLDERNEARHLWVVWKALSTSTRYEKWRNIWKLTDKSNINTTRGEWSTFGCPPQAVFKDPSVKLIFRFLGKTETGRGDTLKDIVIVFGSAEYAWQKKRR